MRINTTREKLLPAVNIIGGVVERRQTLPILGNVLVKTREQGIELTATDLEVEITTVADAEECENGEFTLPAKKFIDICKALPEGANIDISVENEKAVIRSERSKFSLGVLPAADFPTVEIAIPEFSLNLTEGDLKTLIDRTAFSMAQQDVRYYLNGMLLELDGKEIRSVATDGHRLALSEGVVDREQSSLKQILIPRKAVIELGRILDYTDKPVTMDVSSNSARFVVGDSRFTTKLIDGRFPDYQRVIPANCSKSAIVDREQFKKALTRASILSSDKYRGIRLSFSEGMLELQAHNPEQEEAEEKMPIEYSGEEINIGFNVGYLLDILSVIDSESLVFSLGDVNNSALLKSPGEDRSMYVVMPMRL